MNETTSSGASAGVAQITWTLDDIDRSSLRLARAWALCMVVRDQFTNEVSAHCEWVWAHAALERITDLVRSVDAENDEAPHEVIAAVHAARAQCEVLLCQPALGPHDSVRDDEVMDFALFGLCEDLKRARDAVNASAPATRH